MDDSFNSAMSHGLAVLSGGGIAGVVVRMLAGSFLKRLDDIEKTLRGLDDKVDTRHEKLIVEMERLRSMAEVAHKRLDEMGARRARK